MKTKISDIIEKTPEGSLLVGTLTTNDRSGDASTAAIIEGTPEGFRFLATFLQTMADSVESGKSKDVGWHLALSPDDIPALRTRNVSVLSLGCKPTGVGS